MYIDESIDNGECKMKCKHCGEEMMGTTDGGWVCFCRGEKAAIEEMNKKCRKKPF
jgi:hypothetical protein